MVNSLRDTALRLMMAFTLTVMLFSHGTSFAHEFAEKPQETRVCVERAVGPQHHPRVAREKAFCRTVNVHDEDQQAEVDKQPSDGRPAAS